VRSLAVGLGIMAVTLVAAPLVAGVLAGPTLLASAGLALWAGDASIKTQGASLPMAALLFAAGASIGVLIGGTGLMLVGALGSLAAPLAQALVLLWQSRVRPVDEQVGAPGLFGRHEDAPALLRALLPGALVGGRDPEDVEDLAAP
jgi:hypothetical protein